MRRLAVFWGAPLLPLLIVSTAVVAAGPATAALTVAEGTGGSEPAPVMVVLDASGSMAAGVPGGGTKMSAAKQAVHTLVAAVPAQTRMGLTVYGTSTGSAAADKAAGCRDVQVVYPVGGVDPAAIGRTVDGVNPRGYTPIGQALRTAAAALPSEGPRSIVLVSDGEDTCAPPDPCDVAAELARTGVDLRIHTVGFDVSATTRAQLTCIAQASGGTYTNVPDAAGLAPALSRVTRSAIRNYQPAGTPVKGAPVLGEAPVVTPGQYLDTLGFSRRRFYSVDIPAGHTVYVAATALFQRGGSRSIEGLNLSLYGVGGSDCYRFENEVISGGKDGESLSTLLTWNGEQYKSPVDACRVAGRYTFAVYFTSGSDNNPVEDEVSERLPLELQISLEPPALDPGPAPGVPVTFADPGGPTQQIVGGGSFGSAATLSGSGRYAETVQVGEVLYYRVRLNWGQALAYRVDYGAANLPTSAVNVSSRLFSPARGRVDYSTRTYTGRPLQLPPADPAFVTAPIRYTNRQAADLDQRLLGVAGWHYISVKVGIGVLSAAEGAGAGVPLTLTLSVVGDPEPGPTYAGEGPDPSDSAVARSADTAAGRGSGDSSSVVTVPRTTSPEIPLPPPSSPGGTDWGSGLGRALGGGPGIDRCGGCDRGRHPHTGRPHRLRDLGGVGSGWPPSCRRRLGRHGPDLGGASVVACGGQVIDLPAMTDTTQQVLADSDFLFHPAAAAADGSPVLGTSGEALVDLRLGEIPGAVERVIVVAATTERTLHLAAIYRRAGTWRFRAIGQGYDHGLTDLARAHGVDLDQD